MDIKEQTALFFWDALKSGNMPDDQAKRAASLLADYRTQQEEFGAPLFPAKQAAEEAARQKFRQQFDGLNNVSATISPYSEDPQRDLAIHANVPFLAQRFNKTPQEIADRPDYYRDEYARQRFNLPSGTDDKTFYNLAAKEVKQEADEEGRARWAEAEGFKAALEGKGSLSALSGMAQSAMENPDKEIENKAFFAAHRVVSDVLAKHAGLLSPVVDSVERIMDGKGSDSDYATKADAQAKMMDMPPAERRIVLAALNAEAQKRGGANAAEKGGKYSPNIFISTFWQQIGESAGRLGENALTNNAQVQTNLDILPASGEVKFSGDAIKTPEDARRYVGEGIVKMMGDTTGAAMAGPFGVSAPAMDTRNTITLDEKGAALVRDAKSRMEKEMRIQREFSDIGNAVDPIPNVIASTLGSSGMFMAAMAASRGMAAPVLANAYSNIEYNDLSAKFPQMSHGDKLLVSGISAAAQTALDYVGVKGFSKFNIGKLIANPDGLTKYLAARGLGKLALSYGVENLVEAGQDYSTTAIMRALKVDAPGFDVEKENAEFWKGRADVAIGMMPLTMMGIGVASVNDYSNGKGLLASNDELGRLGVVQNDRVPILEAAQSNDLNKAQALLKDSWGRRDPAVADEFQSSLNARQIQVQQVTEELTRRGLIPDIRKEGNAWTVTDGTTTAQFSTWEQAREVATQHMTENERNSAELVAAMADKLILGKGESINIRQRTETLGERVASGHIAPEQAMEAAVAGGVLKGMTIAEARGIAQQVFGGETQDQRTSEIRRVVENIVVAGRNVADGKTSKSTVNFTDNAHAFLDTVEEPIEGRWKNGLANGHFTKAQGVSWVKLAETATGEKFLHGMTHDEVLASAEVSPRALTEAISSIVVADVFGRLQNGKRVAPGSISRGLDLNDRQQGALAAILKAFAEFFKTVMDIADKLITARENFTEEQAAEYDALFDKLTGSEGQYLHESAVADVVAAEMADTSGYSEKNHGPNGETFSLKWLPKAIQRDVFGDWGADLRSDEIYGYRGAPTNGETNIPGGFGNSEGNGRYIAKDEKTAAFFGKVERVKFMPPRKPFVIDGEPLYLLIEDDIATKPIQSSDSTWLKLCKFATAKALELNPEWDSEIAGDVLTDVLLQHGYDSVYVKGDEDFVVILSGEQRPFSDYKRETFSMSRAIPADSSKIVQMPDGARLVGPTTFSIRAFHGTPHKVDKFTTAKIGTGEGAQAYGWGLYFAQGKGVAENYRKVDQAADVISNKVEAENGGFLQWDNDQKKWYVEGGEGALSKETQKAIDGLNYNPQGNLYTVELIPDEADFLDWDKPLSEQSEKVKAALAAFDSKMLGRNIFTDITQKNVQPRTQAGVEILDYDTAQERASKFLASRGIPGIRYLDGNSRDGDSRTSNFVIFDESLVRILEENGKPVETFSLRKFPVPPGLAEAAQKARGESSLIMAYQAVQRGSSSAMVPIRAVYDAAKKYAPVLTPAAFMAQINALNDSGKILIGLSETTKAVEAAGEFRVGGAGTEMAFAPQETFSLAPSLGGLSEAAAKQAGLVGPLYRGFHKSNSDIRSSPIRGGTHFTTDEEYAASYADESGGVMKVFSDPGQRVLDLTSIQNKQDLLKRFTSAGVDVDSLKYDPSPWSQDPNAHAEKSLREIIEELSKDRSDWTDFSPNEEITDALTFSGKTPDYLDSIKFEEHGTKGHEAWIIMRPSQVFEQKLDGKYHQISPESSRAAGGTFSLRSGDFASRMSAAFSPFQRNPELRMAIAQVAKARAQRLGAEWIEKAAVIRGAGDIGKEARMREALAYEARMNEYLDGLTEAGRLNLEFEPASLADDPLVSAMLDFGKLMSFTNAKKAGKVDAKAGDYDGVPWLPPSFYSKGAGIMPDQMAQAMHDAGLLPDAYTDTLWNELGKRIASTKKDKDAHREAVTAYKAAQKYARDASKAEAEQWAEGAKKKATSPKAQRDMLKGALRLLDGILAAAPAEVRAKVGGYVKLAGLATDEAMLQEIERRIEKLNSELEKWLKKEGIAEIEKLFKKARPDSEAGKRGKGKDADTHALFAAAERAAEMNEVAVAGELVRLDSLIAGDTLTPEQEALAITERGIVELVGDLKHADAGRVHSALDTLREIYQGGWLKWKLAQIEKREERAGMRGDFIADTGKRGIKPERDAAEREAETLIGKIKGGFLSLSSFHEVLSYAFGSKSARVKSLVDAEREASGQYEDANQAIADEVQDLFTALAGGKTLAGEKLRFDMAQRTIQTAKGELSQLGAIQALLMWRQEDGRRHMEGQLGEDGKPISSWSYDQAWIDEITAQLTPEARSVMAWIMQKYGAEHAVLNPLYRQRYGVNMPAYDNYAPITVQPVQAKAGEVIDPVSGAAMSSGSILTPGSLRTRSRSAIAEPEFRDALQTFLVHTRQLEYWKAYYDLALESSAILGNREVLNAVKAKGGEQAATALRKWIDAIAQGGFRDASASLEMNKMLQRITGRAASVGLLGRFSTLLVQSTQLGAASVKMPLGSYLVGMSKLLTGNLAYADAIRSPFIQRRYKSAPPIVRQAMDRLAAATRPNEIKQATRALGQLLSGTDALFTAGTYALLLDYHRTTGRALGLTGAELEEHANTEAERDTEQVAQPTRMATRSLMEITSTNPLAKVSWAYASEARQKIALMAWATTKAASEPAQFAKTAFLVFGVGGLMVQILKNLWRERKGDDDEEKWSAKRLTLAALTGPLHGVPLASELMGDQGMLSGVAWAWPALKDVASGEADMRDVDTLLSTLGLFNDTAAAVASLSHAGLDAAKVIQNLADKK